MTTPRQIRANRENAKLSTGPKTAEGKERCRGNALTHGLAAAVLLPEGPSEVLAARVAEWAAVFRPGDPYEAWLLERMAADSLQIERCQAQEDRLRTLQAARAGDHWDDDRRLTAEELGTGLARSPAIVARKLQRTTQGCAWLRERWEVLALALAAGEPWDDARRARALDLLGVAADLRTLPSPLDLAAEPDARKCFVQAQVERLRALQTGSLDDLDAIERSDAQDGLAPDTGRDLALLHRYEAAANRRLQWAHRQLKRSPGDRRDARPMPAARPAATPPLAPAPAPPAPPRPMAPPLAPPIPPTPAVARLEKLLGSAPPQLTNRHERRAMKKFACKG